MIINLYHIFCYIPLCMIVVIGYGDVERVQWMTLLCIRNDHLERLWMAAYGTLNIYSFISHNRTKLNKCFEFSLNYFLGW